jgi:hypothetical protein
MAEKRVIELEVKTTGAENSEKSVKSLKAQLRELKNELAGLDEGSERFKEVAKQAGALQDKIGDANQQVKNFASDTRKLDGAIGGIQAVAGGFGAVTSSMALVGVESEELEKTMMKLQGAMTLVTSIQAVANALNKDSAFMSLVQTTRTNLLTKATVQQAVATGTATTAQKIMNAVMKANPIGLVITALAGLVAGYYAYTKAVGDTIDKLEILRKKEKEIREANARDLKDKNDQIKLSKEYSQSNINNLENELTIMRSKGATEQQLFDQEKKILNERLRISEFAKDIRGKYTFEEFQERKKLLAELEALQNSYDKNRLDKQKENNKKLTEDQRNKYKRDLADLDEFNREVADREKSEQERKEARQFELAEQIAEAERLTRDSALSEEEREILAIQEKYAKLSDLTEEFGYGQNELLEAQKNEENAIRTKFAHAEKLAKEQEDAEKIAQEQALRDAKIMIAQDTLNGLNAIGNAFIKDQKKLEKFNKATALVQIGIDTAKAISSLVAASNANPLNAPTAGGAGIAQLVSGLASILTNIAKAKQILSSSGSSAPSGGSGGGSTASPQQQVTPPSFNIVGQSGVNTLGQQTQPLQAYVVSGEMTSQQALDRNRLKNATFG